MIKSIAKFSSVYLYIVSILILSYEIGILPSSYLLYGIVAFWGIRNLAFNVRYDNIVIAFVFLCLSSYIRIWEYSSRMIFDVSLTFIGVLPFLNNKAINIDIKKLNYFAILFFLISSYGQLNSISLSSLLTFLIKSDLETESIMLSFIFPFFAMYFLINKSSTFFIINIICTIIAGKRIALLALLVGSFLYVLLSRMSTKKYEKIKWMIPVLALLFNILYLFLSYQLASGGLSDLIFEYTGLSSNAFTMGRESLYSTAFTEFNTSDIFDVLLGESKIYDLLESDRLHNDIMVIWMENGLIVFCIFWFLLYRKCNIEILAYTLILNILFMTDNTLVYVPVLFFACFFIRLASQNRKLELSTTV